MFGINKGFKDNYPTKLFKSLFMYDSSSCLSSFYVMYRAPSFMVDMFLNSILEAYHIFSAFILIGKTSLKS